MRIGFAGTPEIAAKILRELVNLSIEISIVITKPDAAVGRSNELVSSPVSLAASNLEIPVIKPTNLNDQNFTDYLESLELDVIIVVAYGKLIPISLLEIPRLGWFNLHFSLLPLYRGAAPVQRAIMNGESETGVTIFQIDSGLDSGPILATSKLVIESQDDAKSLFEKLTQIGLYLLHTAINQFKSGNFKLIEQNSGLATPAPKIKTAETRINWTESAQQILNLIKGLAAGPVAFTELEGNRLKIHQARLFAGATISAGNLQRVQDAIVVGTAEGCLELIEVQPAGKKVMHASQWFNGLRTDDPWFQ